MARKTKPVYKKQDLIKMIVDWTSEGIPQAQIKKDIMKLGYEIAYFYLLLNEAKPLINEMLKGIAESKLEATIAEMEEQYIQVLALGDRRLANDIRKEINKISGLHMQKVDITSAGESITINYKKPEDK